MISDKQETSSENGKKKTDLQEIVSFFKTLAIFIIGLLFFQASVVQAFKIPSGSMKPTLKEWDYIFVNKFAYGLQLPRMKEVLIQYSAPERGDIVVFTRPDDETTPEDESDINVIKRVIGLPGDTVEVRDRTVYINNQKYNEPYARWEEGGIREGNFGPERVPDGHVFLLGDNRDHSKDSRFWLPSPFLDIKRIKGRAMIIYWSWQPDFLSRIGKIIR